MSKCAHKAIKSSKKEVELILDLHENYPVIANSYNWTKGSLRGLIANTTIWFKKEKKSICPMLIKSLYYRIILKTP